MDVSWIVPINLSYLLEWFTFFWFLLNQNWFNSQSSTRNRKRTRPFWTFEERGKCPAGSWGTATPKAVIKDQYVWSQSLPAWVLWLIFPAQLVRIQSRLIGLAFRRMSVNQGNGYLKSRASSEELGTSQGSRQDLSSSFLQACLEIQSAW